MTRITTLSVREAIRAFTRQKSTFAVAVLTLGLGLGLCTAMLCVLYGIILRPLSFGDSERLVMAWASYEGGATARDSFTEQALVEWRQRGHTIDGLVAFRWTTFTLLERGEPASVEGALVTPDFFSVLSITPAAGAAFDRELAQSRGGKVAMISYTVWRQRFNADPDIAGKPMNLGGDIYTVTGVVPDDFDFPTQKTGIWAPLPSTAATTFAGARTLYLVGRLRPSVTLGEGQAEADNVARQLAAEFPDTNRGMRIQLVPFFEELTNQAWTLVTVGSAAAFLTLLICCANVSNLLLVRAIVRRSEFATRLAIGAGRRHLLAVVVVEGVVLAVVGGVLGGALGQWMIEALLRLSPIELPRAATVGRGLQIPLVAGGLVAVAALLVSAPAAWEVARSKLAMNAVVGARTTSRRFARQAIVAVEIAIALTLVAGAGLMARTIVALRDTNPGWRSDNVLAAVVALPRNKYREPQQMRQFFETLIERLRATPGVVSVGASSSLPAVPVGADVDLPIQVPGGSTPDGATAGVRFITPGLFSTLGIPVVLGRDIDDSDGSPTARRIVVNRTFVKRYLPDAPSAIGRQVVVSLGGSQTYEIVGVVADVHHTGIFDAPKPEFFIPFASRPFYGMGIAVRTTGDPLAFLPVFRQALWGLDPALPVASADSMEDVVSNTWNDRTFLTIVIVSLSAVVVLLTVIGVFSVVRFSVSRQVREIAVHIAVGAQRRDVVRMVMGQAARPVAAGVILGLGGAWLIGRTLAGLMYGVSASDPRVLLAGTVGVVIVAAIGAYLPSRRAARLDPALALRLE